jgi:hypothetical protein
MASIMTSIGIRGIGVPCGEKWASDDFILWWKPRISCCRSHELE